MKNYQIATLFGELIWMPLTCTSGIIRRTKSGEATPEYVHESVYTIQKCMWEATPQYVHQSFDAKPVNQLGNSGQ